MCSSREMSLAGEPHRPRRRWRRATRPGMPWSCASRDTSFAAEPALVTFPQPRDELVPGHAAPCGQLLDCARISRYEAEALAGAQREHSETQLEDQLTAPGVASVPLIVGGQVGGAARCRREPSHRRLLR